MTWTLIGGGVSISSGSRTRTTCGAFIMTRRTSNAPFNSSRVAKAMSLRTSTGRPSTPMIRHFIPSRAARSTCWVEWVFRYFSFPCQLTFTSQTKAPGNCILTGCMITFYKNPVAVVGLQVVNQTFNSNVNFSNSSADVSVATLFKRKFDGDATVHESKLFDNWASATGIASGISLLLNK